MNFENIKTKFLTSLKERTRDIKRTRWIRFGIVSLIFFLWVIWLGTWWVALFWFLLFDIYITGYIPLTWWKKSKNKAVRVVMGWVDAIVYALVLVYFVFTFIGQNYEIPSSSLEKSLLVGDYLWVNKMAYGPRVPNTPLHFPLVQNTLPILNTKSYIEFPQWTYHRLAGFGNVERGDIVVFNFPAGDTVALKVQNPDYYTLVKLFGREQVNNNKAKFGDVIYRPVDRRENYVKRAVGLPGDLLKIVNGVIYINGKPIPQPENVQFDYLVQAAGAGLSDDDFERFGIAVDDRNMLPITEQEVPWFAQQGFKFNPDGTYPIIYRLPMTQAMVNEATRSPLIGKIMRAPARYPDMLFPEEASVRGAWTNADYGEIWIPKKGYSINLNPLTWDVYSRAIKNYERNDDAELRGDKVYINGKPQDKYTFKMDYYFMMGDNRDNSLDSRYWGFVPEDHIVGRPEMVLISFDKDKGLFSGGIRWDRVLKSANADKEKFE